MFFILTCQDPKGCQFLVVIMYLRRLREIILRPLAHKKVLLFKSKAIYHCFCLEVGATAVCRCSNRVIVAALENHCIISGSNSYNSVSVYERSRIRHVPRCIILHFEAYFLCHHQYNCTLRKGNSVRGVLDYSSHFKIVSFFPGAIVGDSVIHLR